MAAVMILLLAFGMARFILALSSELIDDGIVLAGDEVVERRHNIYI